MKKLCTILTAIALVFLCIVLLPTEAKAAEVTASGTCGAELTWTLDAEGTLTISGTGAMTNYTYDSSSPTGSTHPWKNVATYIKSVVIENGVTSIGNYAFENCTNLTRITIPDSVTSIGYDAFSSCTSLTGIWADGDSQAYSSDDKGVLFNKTKTELIRAPGGLSGKYDVPDTVTSIGSSAFSHCVSLTSITIPDSVTSIGNSTFYRCTRLTSVVIPDSVTSIGYAAFYNCISLNYTQYGNCYYLGNDSNPYLYLADTISTGITECEISSQTRFIGSYAFRDCTRLTSVVIPDSATSIGDHAFYKCTRLTSVVIPDGVTSIGDLAFYKCTSLTSITIPDSVTGIGYDAFYSCTSLTSVYITDISAWCKIIFGDYDANPLYYAKKLYLNNTLVTELSIPDSVTSIGYAAFYSCTSLTSITIPDSVTSIGSYAFANCTNLTSITIPDSVTSIGSDAFYYCTSLTSITIPDSVTSIGVSAFYHCTSLTSITIPDSVTDIGYDAFYNCTSLTSVVYCGTAERWVQIAIGSNNTYLTSANRSYHNMTEGDCYNPKTCVYCGYEEYPHVWIDATCTSSKFCFLCGATEGGFVHSWAAATCTAPKTCTLCGVTEGDVAHTWMAATCTEAEYCTRCGVTKGEPLGHDWTAANCTDPTTCSRCGLTSDQPLGHKFDHDKDYICNTCGYSRLVAEPTLKFYSATPSLSFQDYIGMQTLIRNVDVAKYDKVYVIAVQEGPDGSVETRLEGIPFYGLYQVFDQQVLSWSMTEQVTLTLYAEADGVIYQGASVRESVESLALAMLNAYKSSNAKLCKVLVDMLNYGAAVQIAFNHNAENLPNAELGELAALGTTGTPAFKAANAISGTAQVPVLVNNISLQAKVEIQMLFSADISDYTAKATTSNGTAEVTIDKETYAKDGWTILRVAIKAVQMRDTFTIALYDANGDPVTQIYNVSVEGYATARQGSAYADVDIAMMRYGDAVAAYAAK